MTANDSYLDPYMYNFKMFDCVFPSPLKPKQPSTEGYIAVILPKFEESKSITENLLSKEQFENLISKRTVAQSQPSWQTSWIVPSLGLGFSGGSSLLLTPTKFDEDYILESDRYMWLERNYCIECKHYFSFLSLQNGEMFLKVLGNTLFIVLNFWLGKDETLKILFACKLPITFSSLH